MNIRDFIKIRRSLMTAVLTTLLVSGAAITAASSSNLTGSVYGQLPPQGDADGDGLLNTWEENGIDVNNDGTIDFVLPQANSLHKNLYVETDYMNFHRPIGGGNVFGASAIEDVRRAFRSAPVSNPDGTTGINLFVQLDENITHQDAINGVTGLLAIKRTNFGTVAERADPNSVNLLNAKRLAFHYGPFVHDRSDFPGSSGVSNGSPGMEFFVSLGAQGYARDPVTNHSVGTRSQQAATFMHELGHNLGLRHGGGDEINCEPNYLSIMSYSFQFSDYVSNRPLDYSRSALDRLDEEILNESRGISQSTPPGLTTIYNGPREPYQGPRLPTAGTPVDFNINGVIDQQLVTSDINGGLACGTPGPGPIATGFNDWSNLRYITTPAQALTPFQVQQLEVPEEQTIDDIRESRLILLEGINNAIQRLIDLQPESTVEFDTSHIAELLQTDQLDAAIAELLELRTQVIDVFGQEAANREVVPQIENLIGALEDQKFPSPPPASACIGTGSRDSVITGTPDPDTLIGTDGHNVISGLGGDDRINGCGNVDSISGGTGDDGIAGGPARDRLHGDEGDDIVQGDAGDDVIFGDSGVNTLTGGPGRDIFFCSPEGETTITDFVPGVDRFRGPCILAATTTTTTTAEASTSAANNVAAQDESMPTTLLPLPLPT
jgi:hypothetical protein